MDCVSPRGHPAHSKLALVFLLLFRVALGLPGAVQSLPLTCSLLPSGDSSLLPSSTASFQRLPDPFQLHLTRDLSNVLTAQAVSED